MAWIRFFTVGFCLSIGTINCEECGCNKIPSIEITNDQQSANEIKEVRDHFLAKQPSSNFNRLSATILIRNNNTKIWRRDSVDGTLIAYPASTVKLMYIYSAMEWCKKRDQSIDCLNRYVRPMIIVMVSDCFEKWRGGGLKIWTKVRKFSQKVPHLTFWQKLNQKCLIHRLSARFC